MKLIILVSILIIYFPVLYYCKKRIVRELINTDVPEYMGWFESSMYILKTTSDETKKAALTKLHRQTRFVSILGIALFWFILLFYPS